MSDSTVDDSARQALLALLQRVQAEPGSGAERWQEVELELSVVAEELRAQQEEIDESLRVMRSQQRLLVHGLSGVPVPMVRLDANGVVRDANAAAHRLLALPATSLVGKPVVTYVTVEERGRVRSALRAAENDSAATTQAEIVTRDGQRRPCVLAFARPPAEGRAGAPGGTIGLLLPVEPGAPDLTGVEESASALARLCGLSLGDGGLDGALSEVTTLMVAAVPGVSAGRIDWVSDGVPLSTADPGGGWDTELDEALATVRATGRSSRTGEGNTSVVSLPLTTSDGRTVIGVLSCRGDLGALDDSTAEALAPYLSSASALFVDAALVRDSERVRAQLEEALASRAVIDQAKGMIMMTVGCTSDEAFQHLVSLSSRANRKLREVAREVVEDMVRQVRARRPHV